jgi:ACS family hexuronate transporter-like MFS transporter
MPIVSKRLRWWIVWALFGSTVINYISRQTLSVLAPVITQELHLSHTKLSWVFSAFQISHAGMWLVGGVLLDIIGTRLGLALAVTWWSVVSMLTGFAGLGWEMNPPRPVSLLINWLVGSRDCPC